MGPSEKARSDDGKKRFSEKTITAGQRAPAVMVRSVAVGAEVKRLHGGKLPCAGRPFPVFLTWIAVAA